MTPAPSSLVEGHLYRVVTPVGPRTRRYAYEHVLTYLGPGIDRYHLQFNARPFAGTQSIDVREIVQIEPLPFESGEGRGREQKRHRMNKRIAFPSTVLSDDQWWGQLREDALTKQALNHAGIETKPEYDGFAYDGVDEVAQIVRDALNEAAEHGGLQEVTIVFEDGYGCTIDDEGVIWG